MSRGLCAVCLRCAQELFDLGSILLQYDRVNIFQIDERVDYATLVIGVLERRSDGQLDGFRVILFLDYQSSRRGDARRLVGREYLLNLRAAWLAGLRRRV